VITTAFSGRPYRRRTLSALSSPGSGDYDLCGGWKDGYRGSGKVDGVKGGGRGAHVKLAVRDVIMRLIVSLSRFKVWGSVFNRVKNREPSQQPGPHAASPRPRQQRRTAPGAAPPFTPPRPSAPMNLAKALSCWERMSGWKEGTPATAATWG